MPEAVTHDQLLRTMDALMDHAEAVQARVAAQLTVHAGIIERYKSLADIERGFRVLKSDLDIAPVFHRLPDRIRAHALICFLAFVLYRVMRLRLKASRQHA